MSLKTAIITDINKVESAFESAEVKALKFAALAQKITNWVKAEQGKSDVQAIEAFIGVSKYTTAATALVVAANAAIQKLDNQTDIDAINGVLLMLGAKLTALLSSDTLSLAIGDAVTAFQKLWDMVK